jgi:hypothetical protein
MPSRNRGKYTINTAYPFSGGHEGKIGVKEDHVLSGATELIKLLEGQETIVKQNVVTRIAALKNAPRVLAVREIIMQEVRNAS